MPDKTKTLDDLAKQVIDNQAGLMSVEDLKVFFEDEQPAQNPTNQTTVEPVAAPAPQASTATPAPNAEPVVSQPTAQGLVPDKFLDEDLVTSVQKLTKSYGEVEAELKREKEERARLETMVQNLSVPQVSDQPTMAMPQQVSQPAQDVDDVDDALFFDKPKEATTKVSKRVASEVAAAMLIAYHNALTEASKRVQYVEAFKAQHPDFPKYREDMAFILRARPELDKKAENLPMVYEMAKVRYNSRLDAMRKELGVPNVQPDIPAAPAPTPIPTTTAPNESELVEKVKTALMAEINRRKAASGLTGGGTPTSPANRSTNAVTQVPKSDEDALFDEMMASGPNRLAINLT